MPETVPCERVLSLEQHSEREARLGISSRRLTELRADGRRPKRDSHLRNMGVQRNVESGQAGAGKTER